MHRVVISAPTADQLKKNILAMAAQFGGKTELKVEAAAPVMSQKEVEVAAEAAAPEKKKRGRPAKKVAAKKAVAKKVEVEEDFEEETEDASEVTRDTCIELLGRVKNEVSFSKCRELLKAHNARVFSDLPESKYAAFAASCEEALAE